MNGKILTLSIFFFIFNGVGGGIFYQWLLFDALNRSTGTGVVPGPWIVMPILSILVLLVSAATAGVIFSENKSRESLVGYKHVFAKVFIALSIIYHALYAFSIS